MRNKTLEDTKEAKMEKRFWALSVLTVFLFAAGTVRAQSVDEKIKSLEQELSQLKDQQVELKKEATAAAAALPEFSYRPGGGVNISAADKSWGINFGFEGHYRMLFESGKDQQGRTNGEVIGRRARPQMVYCINNCFYEIEQRWDMDGFGTNTALQRSQVSIHMEQINPWLPRFSFGMDIPFPVSTLRQGSGNFGAQAEYDILSRNTGLNTGSAGNGITLNWDDIDIGSGRAQFNLGMAQFGEAGDGLSSNTDRKDFAVFGRVDPFAKMKNKWIEGIRLEYSGWFCNEDPRSVAAVNGSEGGNVSACRRLRIQDHGDGGRQTLFQFTPTGTTGRGTNDQHLIGLGWKVGPYQLRLFRTFTNFNFAKNTPTRQGVDAKGRDWLIAHDLFLWSPKGWLTGDSTVPGSVLIGTHFERTDVSCGASNCDVSGQFSRNRVLLREWDLWYFLPSRISIGGSLLWYDASNLRTGRGNSGENLNVLSTGGCDAVGPTAACRGHGGDWVDVMLNFRMYF
jgi:hypothetical protein